jgi:hypothetical protein
MTGLRRYAPMKSSRGTVIPRDVRQAVRLRDGSCVCARAGFPIEVVKACSGDIQEDHVRASHGTGMKSRSTVDNLVLLSASSHRWKTEHGREARPLLLAYLRARGGTRMTPDVEPPVTNIVAEGISLRTLATEARWNAAGRQAWLDRGPDATLKVLDHLDALAEARSIETPPDLTRFSDFLEAPASVQRDVLDLRPDLRERLRAALLAADPEADRG